MSVVQGMKMVNLGCATSLAKASAIARLAVERTRVSAGAFLPLLCFALHPYGRCVVRLPAAARASSRAWPLPAVQSVP